MFLQENGISLKKIFSTVFASGFAFLSFTGLAGSLSATYDPCCQDYCYQDPSYFDSCGCDMPDFVVYADFIYWQTDAEGLPFAAIIKIPEASNDPTKYTLLNPDCDLEPGFRIGLVIDLGCCNWDFYAQYTWLHPCLNNEKTIPFNSSESNMALIPLIQSPSDFTSDGINSARGEWDNNLNVLDFGFGRTFSINCCFDFRPHLGFKATWQDIKFKTTYVDIFTTTKSSTLTIREKIDFDGIGLRGGFDAAWRFSRCFSLVGGLAVSAVWSDLDIHRSDTYELVLGETVTQTVDLYRHHCVLIPVSELLLGLRYDTTICNCYDAFAFIGWENQVWWKLNRFIFTTDKGMEHGPHGNVTYQGLTVRAGFSY